MRDTGAGRKRRWQEELRRNTHFFACFVLLLFAFSFVFRTDVFAATIWKMLWVNVDSVSVDGVSVRMNGDDYARSEDLSKRFEVFVENATNGLVDIQLTTETIYAPVRSLGIWYSPDGYANAWIEPTSIKESLDVFFEKEQYDGIMVCGRLDGFYAEGYWGLGQGPSEYSNGAGYAFVRFLDEADDPVYWASTPSENVPYPEETYVHEWIHEIEQHFANMGLIIPSPHDAEKYGYQKHNGNWLYDYYADILGCRIWDGEKYIGVPEYAWEYTPSSGKCLHGTLEDLPAIQPTCDAAGRSAGKRCQHCGEIVSGWEEIPALGHNWHLEKTYQTNNGYTFKEDLVCADCGEKKTVGIALGATGTKTAYTENYGKLTFTGNEGSVKWTSSNRNVVKVNQKGTILGIAPGKAVITATADGKKYRCIVVVKPRLYANKSSVSVTSGKWFSVTVRMVGIGKAQGILYCNFDNPSLVTGKWGSWSGTYNDKIRLYLKATGTGTTYARITNSVNGDSLVIKINAKK